MKDYRIVKIPKKNGKYRTIYIPDKFYKSALRDLLTNEFFQKILPDHVTGFVHNHNIATNAMQHIGYQYTLSIDLQDFFDTVKKEFFNIYSARNQQLIQSCFIEGRLRQGLPTSPYLSNLAGLKLDEAIIRYLNKNFKKEDKEVKYTRYADDLAFSFNNYEIYEDLRKGIPHMIMNVGFKYNPKKTHLQDSRFGYRRICGVNIGKTDIKVPKHIKKKMRALNYLYQKTGKEKYIRAYYGLVEFTKLKPPREDKEEIRQAQKILEHFRYGSIAKKLRIVKKAIPRQQLGNIVITNDPVYFVGMSLFTTNWSSCMSLRSTNACKKGVWVWNNLEGVSIAYATSHLIKTVAGVSRVAMKQRALVYETDDGERYFGRVYPGSGDLAPTLRKAGFKNASEGRGKRIKGRVKRVGPLPWTADNTVKKDIIVDGKNYRKFILR